MSSKKYPAQTDLFGVEKNEKPTRLGKSSISYREASSIVTKGAGFMESYDYTLNPYEGCSFGCTYCYAAFFARSKEKQDNWGKWLTVKENALALLNRKRTSTLHDKTIYMSSVTDPYQPVERKLELTRDLLRLLGERFQPRLVIQTRSPLVTRDIDLLQKFKYVQVNMTVTTDSEEVRQAFEPTCPNNRVRLQAIKDVHNAGIDSCITLTPLLPVKDPVQLADDLVATGVDNFIVQPFHATKGRFVAGTREQAMQMIEKYNWNQIRYEEVRHVLKRNIPDIGEGKQGFRPPWIQN